MSEEEIKVAKVDIHVVKRKSSMPRIVSVRAEVIRQRRKGRKVSSYHGVRVQRKLPSISKAAGDGDTTTSTGPRGPVETRG